LTHKDNWMLTESFTKSRNREVMKMWY